MPLYAYTCARCGVTRLIPRPRHARRPALVRCPSCGRRTARRDFGAEAQGDSSITAGVSGAWPLPSDGLAVHPKQIEEARAFNSQASPAVAATEYDGVGRPIFRNRRHRAEYGRHWGATDWDGGLSEP